MKISNIKSSWGSTVEFENPLDFFKQPIDFWRNTINDRKLLIFKRMNFELIHYAKFAYFFGNPWTAPDYKYSKEKSVEVVENNIKLITSEFSNKIISTERIGNDKMPWHSDIPNRSNKPFPYRSIWIVKNPNPEHSGKTKWLNISLDVCEPYLTQELRDLVPRVKVLQQSWYAPGTDEHLHNFVKVNPVTGERSLRLNYFVDEQNPGAWIKKVYIDGVEQPDCSLIKMFIKHLKQFPELVHYHQWDNYDIALYDNWPFVHGRTAIIAEENAERKFYRTNIDYLSDTEWNGSKYLIPVLCRNINN